MRYIILVLISIRNPPIFYYRDKRKNMYTEHQNSDEHEPLVPSLKYKFFRTRFFSLSHLLRAVQVF